ncbi:DUF4936 family protein [Massilia alkalitolerans]|jgi:hypothetical protein|uniref:DUF4936 family protein n=1 Tax=Massilia alkalitolerans TaxID=286638 RepID=UPI0003F6D302|nr:DUF4936 family protein [Massilia alkalitolerans]
MIDLYVYYKVRSEDAGQLAPRVRAMQLALAGSGSGTLLQRRPQASDGLQTWMEVYPGVDAAFGSRVEQAVLDAGLAGLIQGARRSEVFIDLIPGT